MTPGYTVTSSADSGPGTLREAIGFHNGSGGGAATITFAANVNTIQLTSGRLTTNGKLTISGPGADKLTIVGMATGTDETRVLYFNGGSSDSLTVTGMTLLAGAATNAGNAISTDNDSASFSGVTFKGFTSSALYFSYLTSSSNSTTITVDGCTFLNNSTSGHGGAIYVSPQVSSVVNVSNSAFANNTALVGGAVYCSGATTINVTNSTFTDNVCSTTGGAIRPSKAMSLSGSTFVGNKSASGGAVELDSAAGTVDQCTFTGNSATTGSGGAISTKDGPLVVTNSLFANNTAAAGGGGISMVSAAVTITNSTMTGNVALGDVSTGGGGAIQSIPNSYFGSITIRNSTITGNSVPGKSAAGGGLFLRSASTAVTLASSILAGNSNYSSPDISAANRTNVNASNSLIGAIDTYAISLTGGNNQFGTLEQPLSAGLHPVGSRGGPTQTVALQYTSPAINKGANPLSLPNDQRGAGFPRELGGTADVGAFEGILPIPFPTANSIINVTASAASAYSFTVTYDDETGVLASSLDDLDLAVAGPFAVGPIVFKGAVATGNQVTGTYEFAAPGGGWDMADNGSYTISLAGNAVMDSDATAHGNEAQTVRVMIVAVPNVYTVDNVGDAADGNFGPGQLTLREAVGLANSNNLGVADVITFSPPLLNKTIALTGTHLTITDPVVIQGPGADKLTLSGNLQSRLFDFEIPGAGTESSVSGLMLTRGRTTNESAGAIWLGDDNLTMTDVRVWDNRALAGGGVQITSGRLRTFDCSFANNISDGNGGAINASFTNGIIELTRTSITGNSVIGTYGNGGGIASYAARMTIRDSVIAGNRLASSQGYSGGGGISFKAGVVVIINSTIVDNTADSSSGGGIYGFGGGALTIDNSTIAGNSAGGFGGGLGFEGNQANTLTTLELSSTIIATNANATFPDLYSRATSVTMDASVNDSVIGIPSNSVKINGSNNQIGTVAQPLVPLLTPLAFHGGGTLALGLLPGSPALNKGANPLNLANDQRGPGFARELGTPDVGALEGVITGPFASTSLANVVLAGVAIYQAVVKYGDDVGLDTTTFDVSDVTLEGPGLTGPTNPASIAIAGSGNMVTVTYTFPAPGGTFDPADNGVYTLRQVAGQVRDAATPTPNAALAGVIGQFQVLSSSVYTVDSLGDVVDGQYGPGQLTLREAVQLANTVTAGVTDTILFHPALWGQSIVLAGTELSITDPVIIQGPSADELRIDGGARSRIFQFAIPAPGGESTIAGVTLTRGRVTGADGGAIQLNDDSLTLNGVTVTRNEANLGGGIRVVGGRLIAFDTTISNNVAYAGGGGISQKTGTIAITRSSIVGNSGTAGGVESYDATATFTDTTIANNTAGTNGGGVSIVFGTASFANVTVSGNRAPHAASFGGGVFIDSAEAVNIRNSTIAYNTSGGNGGGLSSGSSFPVLTLESTLIAHNSQATHPDLFASTTKNIYILGNDNLIGVVSDPDFILLGSHQSGTLASPLNAKLTPLGDLGGPVWTHGLLPGSPALDQGNNVVGLVSDARGLPRVAGAAPDVGACESLFDMPIAQAQLLDVTSGSGSSYLANVTYTDADGINVGSIGIDDVSLAGGAFATPVNATSFSVAGAGSSVTVTYTFPVPGGAWDVSDNAGNYVIRVLAGQVYDSAAMPVAALPSQLDAFRVAVPLSLVVDTSADVVDANDGKLSLREALNRANDEPLHVGVRDIITFDSLLNGTTIGLNSELFVADSVTIQGPGANKLTLSGNLTNRLFTFAAIGNTTEAALSGMTLTKGKVTGSGGAVHSSLALTLTDVVVSNSTATATGGGLYTLAAALKVVDSILIGNSASTDGGGIGGATSPSSIEVIRTTVTQNTATRRGGGIASVSDALTITDSTVSRNVVNGASGPVDGGGIAITSSGVVMITNSTISSNTAAGPNGYGGGVFVESGKFSIFNSTVTRNHADWDVGGVVVHSFVTVTFENTIIAQNKGKDYPDLANDYYQAMTIKVANVIIGAMTDLSISLQGTYETGTLAVPLDARLSELGDFGGPTQTHGMAGNSPALDKGSNPLGLVNDQRGPGFPRALGAVDIGAFEGMVPAPFAGADVPDVTVYGGKSIDIAVTYSDESGIDVTTIDLNDVRLNGPAYPNPVSPTAVKISGAGTNVVATYTFPAPGGLWDYGDNGVYTIAQQALQVYDLDVPTPLPVFPGPIDSFNVLVPPRFVVDEASLTNDKNYGNGKMSLKEAIALANQTAGVQTITFDPTIFSSAMTIADVSETEMVISESLVINGPAASLTLDAIGRHFRIDGPGTIQVAMDHLTLIGGTAYLDGASIWNVGQLLTLDSVTISNNTSGRYGGAIHSVGGSLTLTNCLVYANATTFLYAHGGGISVDGGSLIIRNSTISGNSANGNGGAMRANSAPTLTIENSTIVNNSGSGAGGISAPNSKQVVMLTSTIVAGNVSSDKNANPDVSVGQLFATDCLLGVADRDITSLTKVGGLAGTLANPLNPQLTPLANNDGQSWSHAALPGSPVLEMGSNPSGAAFDQRGPGYPRVLGLKADIGAIEGVTPIPIAAASLPAVTQEGLTSYSFTVTYSDNLGIDITTLNTGDVKVTGPGGFTATPTMVKVDTPTNGTPRNATYTFPAPGGKWDAPDNGDYTVSLNAGQVADVDPAVHTVLPGVLGLFNVTATKQFIVDEISDIADADTSAGHLSLREAIDLANQNTNLNDIISFDPAVFAAPTTIPLLGGAFSITDGATMIAPLAGLTLDAAGKSRLFVVQITNASFRLVTLTGFTLINGAAAGDYGGAIFNDGGAITLNQTIIDRCTATLGAGAVYSQSSSDSDLTAIDCVFRSNSVTGPAARGGVLLFNTVSSELLLQRTVLENNVSSGSGGAIAGQASMKVVESTFSNNRSLTGSGGAIAIAGGGLTLENSTVSGNTAISAGGIANAGGYMLIRHCTVAFNEAKSFAGGIAETTGSLSMENTVVAENTASLFAPDVVGTLKATSSLIGNPLSAFISGTGNLFGVAPRLLPLAANGGITKTHLPAPGSPLRDAGMTPATWTTDQRGVGFSRVLGSAIDIGAVESTVADPWAALAAPVVNTTGGTTYTLIVTFRDDVGIDVTTIGTGDISVVGPNGFLVTPTFVSLDNATNGSPRAATFTFTPPGGAWDESDAGTYSVFIAAGAVFDRDAQPLSVPGGLLGVIHVSPPRTIAVDAGADVFDGDFSSGKLSLREAVALANADVATSDTISFSPTVFPGASTVSLSGVVAVASPLTLSGPGAALLTLDAGQLSQHLAIEVFANQAKTVTLSGITFANGKSSVDGGAVYAYGESLVVVDCVFEKNSAPNGGAIATKSGTLTTTRTLFRQNSASVSGGSLRVTGTTVQILDSAISNNTAASNGGGLSSSATALSIIGSTFSGNSAGVSGGGLEQTSAGVVIRNSTFSANTAANHGGGIALLSGTSSLSIENSTITGNSATGGKGGGLYRSGSGGSFVTSSVITNNVNAKYPDVRASSSVVITFSAIGFDSIIESSGSKNNRPYGEDFKLGPLTDNGGFTLTHIPQPDSPLLDHGSNTVGLTTDQRGAGFPRLLGFAIDIGAIEAVPLFPYGSTQLSDVKNSGATAYTVSVKWDSFSDIKVSSLGDGDLVMTGAFGFSTPAKFVGVDSNTDGSPRIATYQFTPPGGSWDGADNGIFTVAVSANQVHTVNGYAAEAWPLGAFTVDMPATYVVTTVADSGPGSLRDTIIRANTSSYPDTITFDPSVFSSSQTIQFGASPTVMAVTDQLTIIGPGRQLLTIHGNDHAIIRNNSGKALEVRGITFTEAYTTTSSQSLFGGAVRSTGNLTLVDCAFTSSSAFRGAGIAVVGNGITVSATDCVWSGNSGSSGTGAAYLSGDISAVFRDCTFIDNDGGGLVAYATSLQLLNCTAYNHKTTAFDLELTGTGLFRNCTITGNSWSSGNGGGLELEAGLFTIDNCTITGNKASKGGGIWSEAPLTIRSSVVAGNSATSAPDIYATNVVIQDSAIGTSAGFTPGAGSGGNLPFGTDLKLGPFTNNGGPTLTYAPRPGSPLIDAGSNPGGLLTDQRGYPRVNGASVDIGSVEGLRPAPQALASLPPVNTPGVSAYQFTITYYDDVAVSVGSLGAGDVRVTGPGGFNQLAQLVSVDQFSDGTPRVATYQIVPPGGFWDFPDDGTFTFSIESEQVYDTTLLAMPAEVLGTVVVNLPQALVVTTDADSGPGSLRSVIAQANSVASPDLITFDPAYFNVPRTIQLTGGEMLIADHLTIVGPGISLVTLHGGGLSRMLRIDGPGTLDVFLSGLTFTGGKSTGSGLRGGAVLVQGENLTVTDCVFAGNQSQGDGGAIATLLGSSLTLDGNRFEANTVTGGSGGAVYVTDSTAVTVRRTTFIGNTASGYGGGLAALPGNHTTTLIVDSLFSGNLGRRGGGLYFGDSTFVGTLVVRNSTLSANTGTEGGGAITFNASAQLLVQNSTITGNSVTSVNSGELGGGGIDNRNGAASLVLESSIVAGNTSPVAPDVGVPFLFRATNSAIGSKIAVQLTPDSIGNLPYGVDLKLAPLADNGGPTQTHALAPNSPAVNAGANPASLLFDQRGPGFVRAFGAAPDIGAFESQDGSVPLAPPPTALALVNDGSVQRSVVRNLTIAFSQPVTFPGGLSAAIQLTRTGPGSPSGTLALGFSQVGNTINITFIDAALAPTGNSLLDGRYVLTLHAANIAGGSFDGNGDGVGGDDFSFSFHRLFGDADGDADVDVTDFAAFRQSFGGVNTVFDFDNDGDVDTSDFGQFRQRFGQTL